MKNKVFISNSIKSGDKYLKNHSSLNLKKYNTEKKESNEFKRS